MSKPLTPEHIIERSGHRLHGRIVKRLRDLGWAVEVSPYYSDNFTDKPREIDIICERAFPHQPFGRPIGEVVVRLFIECKYVLDPTVLWFDVKAIDRARERICADTGWPTDLGQPWLIRHHYLAPGDVAKLFSTGKGRSEDSDGFARALNQNLNALIYYRHKAVFRSDRGKRPKLIRRLVYPLIVVDKYERLYRTDISESRPAIEITEPFQIEVNYAYLSAERDARNEHFLMDVVSEDGLPDFLQLLEASDVSGMLEYARWQGNDWRD